MTRRPYRQRKHDRITYGGAPREEVAVDHAIAPFDRAARDADATWGADRLVELVSPETAAKYGRTLASLNAAIDANDADRAADRAAACIRGMAAMDAEARAAGHTPPISGLLVCDLDGFRFGVLPDPALWRQAEREHPGVSVHTLREVGILLKAAQDGHPLLAAVKDAFPGAEVTAVRAKSSRSDLEDALEDRIPF